MRRPMVLGVVLLALAAVGCVPLIDPPPGSPPIIERTFRIGPFTLGPGQTASGYQTGVPRPTGDIGLKTSSFRIVDEMGTEMHHDDFHLHHVLLVDPDTPDALCPSRGERFTGSGHEHNELALWGPYSYLIDRGERIDALYEVMNTTPPGTDPMTVYIEYTLGFERGADETNTRGVTPYFLDVTGCGASTYDVPGTGGPGSVHTRSRSWTAAADGLLVWAGGHQHEGGMGLVVEHTTSGLDGCESMPEYEDPAGPLSGEHPMHMSTCTRHDPVEGGDSYTLRSRYDNSRPHSDVMGIVLAYVWHGTQ